MIHNIYLDEAIPSLIQRSKLLVEFERLLTDLRILVLRAFVGRLPWAEFMLG